MVSRCSMAHYGWSRWGRECLAVVVHFGGIYISYRYLYYAFIAHYFFT